MASLLQKSTPWIEDSFVYACSFDAKGEYDGLEPDGLGSDLNDDEEIMEPQTDNTIPAGLLDDDDSHDGNNGRKNKPPPTRGGKIVQIIDRGGDPNFYVTKQQQSNGKSNRDCCPPYLILHDGKYSTIAFLSEEAYNSSMMRQDVASMGTKQPKAIPRKSLISISQYTISTIKCCAQSKEKQKTTTRFKEDALPIRLVRPDMPLDHLSQVQMSINTNLLLCLYLLGPITFIGAENQGLIGDPINVNCSIKVRRVLISHMAQFDRVHEEHTNACVNVEEEEEEQDYQHWTMVQRLEACHVYYQLLKEKKGETIPVWPWESRLVGGEHDDGDKVENAHAKDGVVDLTVDPAASARTAAVVASPGRVERMIRKYENLEELLQEDGDEKEEEEGAKNSVDAAASVGDIRSGRASTGTHLARWDSEDDDEEDAVQDQRAARASTGTHLAKWDSEDDEEKEEELEDKTEGNTGEQIHQQQEQDVQQLDEFMSSHARPSGEYCEDWTVSQHIYKMPRGEGSQVRRKWVSRISNAGNTFWQKMYCPQVGDSVVYIPRAHYDTMLQFPIENYSGPWKSWPTYSPWPVVCCKVTHIRYRFPYEMNQRSCRKDEKLEGVAAILTLDITGVPAQSGERNYPWPSPNFVVPTANESTSTFEVTLFESDRIEFVIPEFLYSWKIRSLEAAIEANDGNVEGIGVTLRCAPYEDESERVVEDPNYTSYLGILTDLLRRDEREFHFQCSGYNALSMEWELEDGAEEEEAIHVCAWDVTLDNTELPKVPSMSMETKKELLNALKEVMRIDDKIREWFYYQVNESQYIDYFDMIEVPMYINLIESRLQNDYYTNKYSVLSDVELIKDNCYKYNKDNNEFYESACQMYDKFKSLVEAIETPEDELASNNESEEVDKIDEEEEEENVRGGEEGEKEKDTNTREDDSPIEQGNVAELFDNFEDINDVLDLEEEEPEEEEISNPANAVLDSNENDNGADSEIVAEYLAEHGEENETTEKSGERNSTQDDNAATFVGIDQMLADSDDDEGEEEQEAPLLTQQECNVYDDKAEPVSDMFEPSQEVTESQILLPPVKVNKKSTKSRGHGHLKRYVESQIPFPLKGTRSSDEEDAGTESQIPFPPSSKNRQSLHESDSEDEENGENIGTESQIPFLPRRKKLNAKSLHRSKNEDEEIGGNILAESQIPLPPRRKEHTEPLDHRTDDQEGTSQVLSPQKQLMKKASSRKPNRKDEIIYDSEDDWMRIRQVKPSSKPTNRARRVQSQMAGEGSEEIVPTKVLDTSLIYDLNEDEAGEEEVEESTGISEKEMNQHQPDSISPAQKGPSSSGVNTATSLLSASSKTRTTDHHVRFAMEVAADAPAPPPVTTQRELFTSVSVKASKILLQPSRASNEPASRKRKANDDQREMKQKREFSFGNMFDRVKRLWPSHSSDDDDEEGEV